MPPSLTSATAKAASSTIAHEAPSLVAHYRIAAPEHPLLLLQVLRDMGLRCTPILARAGVESFAVVDGSDTAARLAAAADEVAFRAIARSARWGLCVEVTGGSDSQEAVEDLIWTGDIENRPVASTVVNIAAPAAGHLLRTLHYFRFDDALIRARFIGAVDDIVDEFGGVRSRKWADPACP